MNNLPVLSANEVIVCDDEADIRDLLSAILMQAGYEPLAAETGRDVERLIRSHKPRALLLDIRMPEEDGFEVAERLRRRGENIPIVFITAHDNFFCRLYSPAIGASGYFTKPLDMGALIERINLIVNKPAAESPCVA